MRIHSFLSPFKTGPENVSGFQGVGTVYFSKSGSENPEGFQQDRKHKKISGSQRSIRIPRGSCVYLPRSEPEDTEGFRQDRKETPFFADQEKA